MKMQAKFSFIIYIGIFWLLQYVPLIQIIAKQIYQSQDTSSCPSTQRVSFYDNSRCCNANSQELTENEINRVQNIWDLLFSNPLETGIEIMSRASDIYPEFRQFIVDFYNLSSAEDIPNDRKCQRQALRVVSTVNIFVKSIPYIHTVEHFLFYVGKRHQKLGIRMNDFKTFRQALFYVMDRKLEQLGTRLSQEDETAWNKALDMLIKPIIKGYESKDNTESNSS